MLLTCCGLRWRNWAIQVVAGAMGARWRREHQVYGMMS